MQMKMRVRVILTATLCAVALLYASVGVCADIVTQTHPGSSTSTTTTANSAVTSATATSATRSTLVPPVRKVLLGKRISLSSSTLYIPDHFRADQTSNTELLLFFHGAAWVAEQNFEDAGKNAVLLTMSMGMDKYSQTFSTSGALERLIREAERALADASVTSAPVERICLSSFSGGYGAVREILNSGVRSEQITDVVLADSLYGPRVPGHDDQLVTTATQPFLEFAREAAEADTGKRFFFSQLYPPEEKHRGNTTTIAAYYLTDTLAVKRLPADGQNSRGAKLLYRADKGGFHVLGYIGMTTQDHFEHYYAIADLWKLTSLTDVAP